MGAPEAQSIDLDESVAAILAGDRVALGRAITLVESAKPKDQAKARALLEHVAPHTGKAVRVGITGVPGAGIGPSTSTR